MVDAALRRYYLDASALVKLLVSEPETEALIALLAGDPTVISSRIAWVELRRVLGRQSETDADQQLDGLMEGVLAIELDEVIAVAAGGLAPPTLRSLDAIHIASALAAGDELTALVTYDRRMAAAAQASGLAVEAPA